LIMNGGFSPLEGKLPSPIAQFANVLPLHSLLLSLPASLPTWNEFPLFFFRERCGRRLNRGVKSVKCKLLTPISRRFHEPGRL
jgi:hypothetical protein